MCTRGGSGEPSVGENGINKGQPGVTTEEMEWGVGHKGEKASQLWVQQSEIPFYKHL